MYASERLQGERPFQLDKQYIYDQGPLADIMFQQKHKSPRLWEYLIS